MRTSRFDLVPAGFDFGSRARALIWAFQQGRRGRVTVANSKARLNKENLSGHGLAYMYTYQLPNVNVNINYVYKLIVNLPNVCSLLR